MRRASTPRQPTNGERWAGSVVDRLVELERRGARPTLDLEHGQRPGCSLHSGRCDRAGHDDLGSAHDDPERRRHETEEQRPEQCDLRPTEHQPCGEEYDAERAEADAACGHRGEGESGTVTVASALSTTARAVRLGSAMTASAVRAIRCGKTCGTISLTCSAYTVSWPSAAARAA